MKKPKQSLLLVLGQQIVDKIPENLNEQILRKAETCQFCAQIHPKSGIFGPNQSCPEMQNLSLLLPLQCPSSDKISENSNQPNH